MIGGLFQGLGIGLGFMYISKSIISKVVSEKEHNLKNQMRISGVSLPAYWIGHYISDVIFSLITTTFIFILMEAYDSKVPGTWVLILLMTFTNPIFLYVFSLPFSMALTARNGVQYIYLFVGVLAPFILPLVQLIN